MFSKKNRQLLLGMMLLVMIGIIMVYSSSRVWAQAKFNDEWYFMKRQSIFALIGFMICFAVSNINIKSIRKYHKGLLIGCLVMMVLVLIPGIGVERNGSRSWFAIGSFLIQPSEFLKIAMIFHVSELLAKKKMIKNFKHDLLPIFIKLGIGFALIMLQPDFGSGMVLCCCIVAMLIAANTPWKYFIRLASIAILGLVGLIISAPYRLARITAFLDPYQDPLGAGFQSIQSLFAIAPGGLLGVGFNQSMQKHFYLPEPQTDFIFAIFCEEFGFVGACLLVTLYGYLIYLGIKVAKSSQSYFLTYVAVGITFMFATQVMINLGVVVGVLPVTGVTLPFMSYGGSSLIVVMASIGLLMAINNQKS